MMTFESMLVNMFYSKKWLASAFALDNDLKLLGCDAVKKFKMEERFIYLGYATIFFFVAKSMLTSCCVLIRVEGSLESTCDNLNGKRWYY